MIKTVVLLMALAYSSAMAAGLDDGDWKGHLTTLFDAQVACTKTDSPECEPFLAEAVAVADVFGEIAKLEGAGWAVVFHSMTQENCSQSWMQFMNGESLLHSALALPVSIERAKNVYFTQALIRVSRNLCHS
jgi:hypothetical protein